MGKDGDELEFCYRPIERLSRNFGAVHPASGSFALQVFELKAESVGQPRRLDSLGLRQSCGLNVLGIARIEDGSWEVKWCPQQSFEVCAGDLCVGLPLPTGILNGARTL